MKIERSIHFKATISDLLFFWMLRAGIELAEELDDGDNYVDTFPFLSPKQVSEQIEDPAAWDEWNKLVSAVRRDVYAFGDKPELLLISSIYIRPEHPTWDWYYVLDYDTCTYEEFLNAR